MVNPHMESPPWNSVQPGGLRSKWEQETTNTTSETADGAVASVTQFLISESLWNARSTPTVIDGNGTHCGNHLADSNGGDFVFKREQREENAD